MIGDVMEVLVLPDHPVRYRREVANIRQYYQIRQDDEIDPSLYKRPGLDRPCVFRLEVHGAIPMTQDIQEFLFELNEMTNAERKVFADCWDTWATNYGKIRDCRNFITGENAGKDLPKWTNLVCGKNVLCGKETVRNGVAVLEVETLDPDNLPFGMKQKGNEHLIHDCTIITDVKYEGFYKVNPFPQLLGRYGRPVLYGLMSRVPVYIPMWMLKKLPLGTPVPSSYWPEWNT
jgi:hypothetical protein